MLTRSGLRRRHCTIGWAGLPVLGAPRPCLARIHSPRALTYKARQRRLSLLSSANFFLSASKTPVYNNPVQLHPNLAHYCKMSAPVVTPITSFQQFQDLLDSKKLFVIDFWATWCGPCRMIRPVFEKLAAQKDLNEKIEFFSVDVDEQSEIAQEVAIRAMPTFMVFKDGIKIDEFTGAVPNKLQAMVAKAAA
ncbi:thioredoxin-like protein [Calocera viscosa TUFC12733]|uniref:Thioredoxin n=1 Tax=Calocera viscosa (strain TUFC12733) TaxID=1330018 RepID=A0A167H557_CALVF|nr:thioredoxin-like protein [Calocera viscosa TUFC12733]